jgi:lysozyme
MNYSVPTQAYDIIKYFEGCKLEAYRCPSSVVTIGWGTTGAFIRPGMRISQKQADLYLQEALISLANSIPENIWTKLQTNQRAALLSFLYNVGIGALDAPSFGKAIRNNLEEVPKRLLDWDKAIVDGVKSPLLGLTRRRRAEAILWSKGVIVTDVSILDNWDKVQNYLRVGISPFQPPAASSPISLVNAAKYYRDIPHQTEAFKWLDSQITATQRATFGTMYRALSGSSPKDSLPVASKPQPYFIFDMPLRDEPSSNIIVGTLRLKGFPHGDSLKEWDCTSGQPRYQYSGGTSMKGLGPLPGHRYVKDESGNPIKHYWLNTSPYDLKGVKGIDGNAFHILPDPINISGVWRSELMLHNDANRLYSPGSAGCIVALSDSTWSEIEDAVNTIRRAGFDKVPLEVNH